MAAGDEPFSEALDRKRSAMEAMYRGDPAPFEALWSTADDVTLLGARASCVGWAELPATLARVASHYHDDTVTFDDLVVHEGADVAFNVRFERGRTDAGDGSPRVVTIRATQIYRLEDRRWRLVHRHGDFVAGP